MIEAEDLYGQEWASWSRLTPEERWEESARLWHHYVAMGGSLDPEPIRRALFTIRRHRVAHLLMGGQACVLYGAAEFSRT